MNRPIQLFASINAVQAISSVLAKGRPLIRLPRPPILAHNRKETNEEKLMDVTVGAHDILFTASSIFPFVIFTDSISMDRQQLTIIHRSFFSTANSISVRVEDVLNVESNVGPLFGSIHIFSKFFTNDIKSIGFLSRSNTLKIQRLIQGYMIAHHRKIDCSTIEKRQLIVLLNDLGQGAAKQA
jgi:hypothetical protein